METLKFEWNYYLPEPKETEDTSVSKSSCELKKVVSDTLDEIMFSMDILKIRVTLYKFSNGEGLKSI